MSPPVSVTFTNAATSDVTITAFWYYNAGEPGTAGQEDSYNWLHTIRVDGAATDELGVQGNIRYAAQNAGAIGGWISTMAAIASNVAAGTHTVDLLLQWSRSLPNPPAGTGGLSVDFLIEWFE
jgi:hypothetical protein